jgi:hypothetical protein
MYRFLMILGGLDQLASVALHISFWKLFNWPVELARLSPLSRGTVQVLDIVLIYIICWAAGVTFYFAWVRPRGNVAALTLLFIGSVPVLRAAAEVPLYGWTANSPAIIVSCLLSAACYFGAMYYALRGGSHDAHPKCA